MTSLEGKVALVTGAASGIGLAIARDFAQQGMRVTCSDIDVEQGQAVTAELPGARFQKADMTNGEDLQQLVTQTIAAEGQIDILVNNAGIQYEIGRASCRERVEISVGAVDRKKKQG